MFLKLLTTNLPGLGHAATVLAALVALTALVLQARAAAESRTRETATEIRRELLGFSHSIELWNDVLDNNSLMFVAAATTAKELEARDFRVPAPGTVGGTDPDITLAVSLGWNEARSPSRLDSADEEFRLSSHRLTGTLALLHEATGILTAIRWEYYSQVTVSRAVHLWKPDKGPDLESFLVNTLAGLDKEIKEGRHLIIEFVKSAVALAVSLPDRELVRSSQDSVRAASTHTGDMYEFVRRLSVLPSVSDDDREALTTKLDAAMEALRKVGLIQPKSGAN